LRQLPFFLRIWSILFGCGILAVLVNNEMSLLEVMWSFSMYLEAVALVPQIAMLEKTERPKAINTIYIFLLALYNALYVANWIYKYYNSDGNY
jgi:ER lumen protein retaining receptor